MPTNEQAAPANGNKPVHTVRHRSIKASIWKNDTSVGPMYNVTIVRSWRDDEGWHDGRIHQGHCEGHFLLVIPVGQYGNTLGHAAADRAFGGPACLLQQRAQIFAAG